MLSDVDSLEQELSLCLTLGLLFAGGICLFTGRVGLAGLITGVRHLAGLFAGGMCLFTGRVGLAGGGGCQAGLFAGGWLFTGGGARRLWVA